MPYCLFRDRLGNTLQLTFDSGKSILQVLSENRIPLNAAIAYVDGTPQTEDTLVLGDAADVVVEMVRGYDLLKVREIIATPPPTRPDAYYHKQYLDFSNDSLRKLYIDFDRSQFIEYVDNTFEKTVRGQHLLEDGDDVLVGFSGGRDSTTMMLLFDRLPPSRAKVSIHAATLLGLPDWNDRLALSYTADIARSMGIDYFIIPEDEIRNVFNLRVSLEHALGSLLRGDKASYVIFIGHHVVRRMLETRAHELGIRKIILGLNAEDLLAGVLMSYTTGFMTPSLQHRPSGEFDYLYPLMFLTKKELTLYLEALYPQYVPQSQPSPFNRGPLSRSYYYALADYLQEIWPGIEHHMFEAYERICTKISPPEQVQCENCQGHILVQDDTRPELCDACRIFKEHGWLR